MRQIGLSLALAMAVTAVAVMAAALQAPEQKPAFEVVSVKAAKLGARLSVQDTGARFSASNIGLKRLLLRAYAKEGSELFPNQIVGGPNWIETDRFEIEAKPRGDVSVSRLQMWEMVQSLLEDRFLLKTHRETRDLPVYNLINGKSGTKVKLSEDQSSPDVDSLTAPNAQGARPFFDPKKPLPRGIASGSGDPLKGMTYAGSAVPLSKLAQICCSLRCNGPLSTRQT